MRGNPVDDDADACRVQPVHQPRESLGRAVAAGGREQPNGLVSPGSGEGMFRHRQEFHMGEAHFGDIGNQQIGDGVIIEDLVLAAAPPGSQVDLVDRDRGGAVLPRGPVRHPVLVVPGIIRQAADDRGRAGRLFMQEAHRVGLQRHPFAMGADDLVFVQFAHRQAGDEQFPQARSQAPAHGMAAAVPGVEIAHHADPPRIGRPDGKCHAVHAPVGDRMRAQLFVKLAVPPFGDQVFVHLAQDQAEAIRVLDHPAMVAGCHLKLIAVAVEGPGKEALGVDAFQRRALAVGQDRNLGRLRGEDPHLAVMGSEDRERVGMAAAQNGFDFRCGSLGHWSFPSSRSRIPFSGMPIQAGLLLNS